MREINKELMFSSKTDLWETPQELFDKYNEIYHFQTDVCALPENAKCENYFTPEMDGLKQEWKGVCWCNPPYGRKIGKWVEKAAKSTATVVMLLPARTDTKWFHDYCLHYGKIEFLKGRLRFGGCKNSAPFPSMIVVFQAGQETLQKYIAEKDAEIERLKEILYDAEGVNLVDYWHQQCKIAENGCRNFEKENKKLQAEIENYKHLDVILNTAIDKLAKDLKSEAYREFAERVKEEKHGTILTSPKMEWVVRVKDIDNLLKELVGEDGQSGVALACDAVVNDSPVDCQSRGGTEHRSARPPVPTSEKEDEK